MKKLINKISVETLHYAILLQAGIAMAGSLFFSEVMALPPCVLCWYQRILMYPQTLLLYMSILRKEPVLKPYLLALNVIGASIATYHYALQKFPQTLIAPCTVVGASESCIKGYSFYFGYISIPFMALTAFILNIIFLSLTYAKNSQRAK
jgi:disulfide bond formation protein DsbB